MGTIKEEAESYEPKKIKTVADLEFVMVAWEVKENTEAEYPYKYVEVDGDDYKMPLTVLAQLQEQLKETPNLERFKVKSKGEGIKTTYTLVTLD